MPDLMTPQEQFEVWVAVAAFYAGWMAAIRELTLRRDVVVIEAACTEFLQGGNHADPADTCAGTVGA